MFFARLIRLAGLPLLLATSQVMAADAPMSSTVSKRVPQPVIEPARGGQCVEDPAFMRRNHMELLKHQRDDTVRGGIRGAKYSLKTCIACHASQTTDSVAASQTNFCLSCHSFAAVKIDCFECHATQPKKTSFLPLVHPVHANSTTRQELLLRNLVVQQQVKP